MENYTVFFTEPTMVNGQHYAVGESAILSANDALSVVGAGRGTIDPDKAPAPADAPDSED